MAFQFPNFKGFAEMSAKSRIFIVLAVLVLTGLVIYLIIRYFEGATAPVGASRVATAPSGLQSVPGSQVSPEFYRAVMEANVQSAQQAKITGQSAVPTLVNIPGEQPQSANCTIVCSDESINVENDINDLVKAGKLAREDADKLIELSKNNASVDEYTAALNDLVRQGKLTPDQARQLLERYKRQHENQLLKESAKKINKAQMTLFNPSR